MTDANANGGQAVNNGTNQPATGDPNAIIPNEGTNLDTQHDWKQYGENETDALNNLMNKVSAGDKQNQDMSSRLEKMEDRLTNKEDFINQQAQELGQARQSGQSAEVIAKVSQDFSDIMEGEDASQKLDAISQIAKWQVQEGEKPSRNARNAFYAAIDGDSELNTKSFDWLQHKAEANGVSLDRIGTTKQMKQFLSQVKPQKAFDPVAEREKIRQEELQRLKSQGLAVGTNMPAGNGQAQGTQYEGKKAEDMSQDEFLMNAFQHGRKTSFSNL